MAPHYLSGARRIIAATLLVLGSMIPGSVSWAQSPKTLVFATDPTYPPFEFTKDGKLMGFDIDLMAAISKAAGFKADIESVPFDGIIPALKAGTYDGAIAAMSATEERAKSIAFSKPYFKTGLVILVRSDDKSIFGEADLKGKKIAVEIGSVGAEKAATIPDAKVSTFNGAPATLLELANGNADAVINDGGASQYAVGSGEAKGIKIVPGLISTDFYAIGFPKDSKNTNIVDAGLEKIIDSGEYAAIYRRWFNEEPPPF